MDVGWLRRGFIILVVLVAGIALLFTILPSSPKENGAYVMTEGELIRLAKAGLIARITVDGRTLTVERVDGGGQAIVRTEGNVSVCQLLADGGVEPGQLSKINVNVKPSPGASRWLDVAVSLVPFIVLASFLIFFLRRQKPRSPHSASAAPDSAGASLAAADQGHVKTYRLSAAAIPKVRWRMLRRGGALLILSVSFIGVVVSRAGLFSEAPDPLLIGGIVLVFFVAIFSAGLVAIRQLWSSYELTLGDDFVAKKQPRVPDLRIRREEVTRLQEQPGEGLFVCTADRRVVIAVPSSLEGYEEVRERLSQWAPLEPTRRATKD